MLGTLWKSKKSDNFIKDVGKTSEELYCQWRTAMPLHSDPQNNN